MYGFVLASSVLFLVAASMAAWRLWMLLAWKRRPATVVSYVRSNVRGKYLLVRFATDEGEQVEATDESPMMSYWEGQEIRVLVVPDSDPPLVVVPEFLRFWLWPLILCVMGGGFLHAFVSR